MILIVCTDCALAMRVEGAEAELDFCVGKSSGFWPDKYPCPECDKLCMGMLEMEAETDAVASLRVIDVTPSEAFAALNGLGFPSERMCTKEIVERLLKEHPIRKVSARDVQGAERCVVDHLELWDGSKMYFGPSSQGAVVYRITRPHSYVKQVDNG